jgi:hypothetical protein
MGRAHPAILANSRWRAVMYLALRSLGYLAAILMGLAVGAWLLRESAESEPLIERGGVIFSVVLSLGFNLLFGVNDLLGQGVLFNFVAGRYRRPRVEDRVLLFIDMESSTVIAERLGEAGFLDFLNRFVADVTESIMAQRGAIHKYVGDEIIVTWPLAAGLRDGHCVRACFDALEQLDERANAYIRDFGLRANFRAALHCEKALPRSAALKYLLECLINIHKEAREDARAHSPVATSWDTSFADAHFKAGTGLLIDAEHEERGIYASAQPRLVGPFILFDRPCFALPAASTCGGIRISGSRPSPIYSMARSCIATASVPQCRSGQARSTG